MKIILTCAWERADSREYECYSCPAHGAIESFRAHMQESLYFTAPTIEQTVCQPYSSNALRKVLAETSGEASVVVGLWNAEYGARQCTVHLAMGTGPLMCSVTFTIRGALERLFAMQGVMLHAAGQLAAVRARVVDGDVIALLVKAGHKTKGGELAYIRRPDVVEIEGFTAQRHGDGVLYVMDRDLAESGVEARTAAILRLQPLYDALS